MRTIDWPSIAMSKYNELLSTISLLTPYEKKEMLKILQESEDYPKHIGIKKSVIKLLNED